MTQNGSGVGLEGANNGGNTKAGDILNFLPVAAAAAAAAAVAANGNGSNFASSTELMMLHLNGQGGGGGGTLLECNNNSLPNGCHDLNGTSELLNAAAKLINGTAAGASVGGGGGGGGVPPMNGGGCQDPSVSTTQVTIPKDVSINKGGGGVGGVGSMVII